MEVCRAGVALPSPGRASRELALLVGSREAGVCASMCTCVNHTACGESSGWGIALLEITYRERGV